jgi:hypothetical protein
VTGTGLDQSSIPEMGRNLSINIMMILLLLLLLLLIFNSKLAVARWQWLLCIYINVKQGSKKFMAGGLHEKHAVAT